MEVEHLVSSQCRLGEGPIWHPLEQVLYWLDIYQDCLHRYDAQAGLHTLVDLGILVSAMGARASGGFVMATQKGFALWSPETRAFDFIGDLDPFPTREVRFNDGKTDYQGRFWAGKMSSTSSNALYRLGHDHKITRMEGSIGISNGLGWSPDHRTFYYTDSTAKRIYTYDFDPASGDLRNRRVFTQIPDAAGDGFPDGLAVDVDGCLWSARWGGWKVVRYDPSGRVIAEIAMPVEFPTSCAFGGPNLDDLYITSAWDEVLDRAAQPLAGDLFRCKPGVRGFAEPLYQG